VIKFYGRSTSDSVQKTFWILCETEQPYEHIQLGGKHGGLDDPAYLALNPHARVQTLCDGDLVVWESNAIIRYLAATYASGSLWPVDAAKRAEADQWMEWAQTMLYPDFNKLFWLTIRAPIPEQDQALIAHTLVQVNEYYRVLEQHLAGRDYVLGESLTMADFPSGATLYRYFEMPVERPRLPNIQRWYESLKRQPACQAHVMVPFEDLRGRLAH